MKRGNGIVEPDIKICSLCLISPLCACSGGSSSDKKGEQPKNQAPVAAIKLDTETITVRLPTIGVINTRLKASVTGQVYVDGSGSHFTHQYQVDDSQEDSLALTICN